MTEPAPILVLTHDDDPTADVVLHELNLRGTPFVRCDPGDFPISLRLTARLDAGGMVWDGRFEGAPREIDLRSIRAIYYRRPSDFRLPDGRSSGVEAFARSQARHGFSGVLSSLPDAVWLNSPSAMADARVKPHQLAVASRCGLQAPATLLTNEPAAVSEFARSVGGRIITKSLATMVTVDDEQGSGVLYTSEVAEDLWGDPGIAATAHLFQEFVTGVDIRLTVIDGQFFAAEIHPEDLDGPIDIRAHHESVSYRPIEVPADVRRAVLDLLRELRLVFAAIDFRNVPGRGWVFLEVNPNGQWAFIPQLRHVIARAITEFLESSSR
ncbi:ATP-grasp ribosomal peptide maturase [Kribbella sancticallisti]|uniref:ATP-grasp ribosomal peptide maturase n=1 Tax=Kribbella sancticallisti TaxID=460087 RepID=A0ABN2CHW0_9ACTN